LNLSSDTNHFIDLGAFEDELKTILKIRSDYEYQLLILFTAVRYKVAVCLQKTIAVRRYKEEIER